MDRETRTRQVGAPGVVRPARTPLRVAAAAGLLAVNAGLILASRPGDGAVDHALPEATTRTVLSQPRSEQHGPPIGKVPGRPEDTSRVSDISDVERLNYLTEPELEAYRSGGPSAARMALNRTGATSIVVIVVRMRGTAAAHDVRDQVHFIQRLYGMDKISWPVQGVLAAGADNAPGLRPVLRRAHFAAGSQLVRVEVSGKQVAEVNAMFDTVLQAQLAVLPADRT